MEFSELNELNELLSHPRRSNKSIGKKKKQCKKDSITSSSS